MNSRDIANRSSWGATEACDAARRQIVPELASASYSVCAGDENDPASLRRPSHLREYGGNSDTVRQANTVTLAGAVLTSDRIRGGLFGRMNGLGS